MWLFVAAGSVLLFFSMPVISNMLIAGLERPFYKEKSLPDSCSAIVVLGGGGAPMVPPRSHLEINDAGDRIIHGARLYKKGLCKRIITTGGWVDPAAKEAPSEGLHNAMLLIELGVDSSSVIIEKKAKNTHEHGPNIAHILDSLHLPKKIILVTTASHMIRSEAVFKKYGFSTYPSPTDFQRSQLKRTFIFSFFPKAESLHLSSTALHEYYGIIGYKLLGWI